MPWWHRSWRLCRIYLACSNRLAGSVRHRAWTDSRMRSCNKNARFEQPVEFNFLACCVVAKANDPIFLLPERCAKRLDSSQFHNLWFVAFQKAKCQTFFDVGEAFCRAFRCAANSSPLRSCKTKIALATSKASHAPPPLQAAMRPLPPQNDAMS